MEQKLLKLWILTNLIDETLTEIPQELFKRISNANKSDLKVKLHLLIKSFKKLNDVNIFGADEKNALNALDIDDYLIDLYNDSTLEERCELSNIYYEYKQKNIKK